MGKSDYYKSGDWNAECDVCGQKYKASKLKKRWDGLLVCSKDWEPRHPQDFVRGVKDTQSTPFTKDEAVDSITYTCGPCDQQAIAGIAVSGCAIVGQVTLSSIDLLVCQGI